MPDLEEKKRDGTYIVEGARLKHWSVRVKMGVEWGELAGIAPIKFKNYKKDYVNTRANKISGCGRHIRGCKPKTLICPAEKRGVKRAYVQLAWSILLPLSLNTVGYHLTISLIPRSET